MRASPPGSPPARSATGIEVLQQTVGRRGGQSRRGEGLRAPGRLRAEVRRDRRLHERSSGPGAHGRLGRVLVDDGALQSAGTRAPTGSSGRARAAAARARRGPAHRRTGGAGHRARSRSSGFVMASFNLDAVGTSLRESYGGPRGLEFVLADAKDATVLTRSIDPERWIGKPSRAGERDLDGKPAVRERDGPRGRLARPRRRRPRPGAGRHPAAQPPRADDHPRRAGAVPAGDRARAPARRPAAGAARRRDSTAPRPRACRAWCPSTGPRRSPRWRTGSTSSAARFGASRRPTASCSTAARCRCGCTTSRPARSSRPTTPRSRPMATRARSC